jgi:hypothetical protein
MDYVDKLPTCQWCSFAPPEWRIFTPPLTQVWLNTNRTTTKFLFDLDGRQYGWCATVLPNGGMEIHERHPGDRLIHEVQPGSVLRLAGRAA